MDDDSPSLRRQMNLVATVDPPIAWVTVYFKVWDVDDPFDQFHGPDGANDVPNVRLIDNNMAGSDNRPSGEAPRSYTADTGADGRAVVTVEVSMQPGNNYRAGTSCLADALTQVDQTDADALSVEFDVATQRYIKNGSFDDYEVPVVWSEMLTVWRKLDVVTGSMVRPTFAENTNTTQWSGPMQGDTPDRVELKVNDPCFAFDTADGQFDEGWIELSGDAGTVIGHIFEYESSAGWDEATVTIAAADGLDGEQGLAGLGA